MIRCRRSDLRTFSRLRQTAAHPDSNASPVTLDRWLFCGREFVRVDAEHAVVAVGRVRGRAVLPHAFGFDRADAIVDLLFGVAPPMFADVRETHPVRVKVAAPAHDISEDRVVGLHREGFDRLDGRRSGRLSGPGPDPSTSTASVEAYGLPG